MGFFDDWKKIAVIGLVAIIGIALLTNQVYFTMFMILVAICGTIIFLYLQKKELPKKPLEVLREQLLFLALDKSTKLGLLWLSGGSSSILPEGNKKRYYGKRLLGKIQGYTIVDIPPSRLSSDEKASPWSRLTVFRYTPRGTGRMGWLKYKIFQLPILKMFRKDRLFLVNDAQLSENSLTEKDIVLLGTALDYVAIFSVLATPDLDKDVLYDYLGVEAKRLTLETVLNEMTEIVDNAIESSPAHQKILEMMQGKAQDFGIKR